MSSYGFSKFQLRLEDDRVEFKEAPNKEVMHFARSVIWTKASTERMEAWTEQMKGLGYAGREPKNEKKNSSCVC